MDTSISTQMAQAKLVNQVQTAVLAKSLQTMKQGGADLAQMMAQAAPVQLQDTALGQHVNKLA